MQICSIKQNNFDKNKQHYWDWEKKGKMKMNKTNFTLSSQATSTLIVSINASKSRTEFAKYINASWKN